MCPAKDYCPCTEIHIPGLEVLIVIPKIVEKN